MIAGINKYRVAFRNVQMVHPFNRTSHITAGVESMRFLLVKTIVISNRLGTTTVGEKEEKDNSSLATRETDNSLVAA